MTPHDAYMKTFQAKKRLLELEPLILQEASFSYFYALNIIKGRWEEAEANIATNIHFSYYYALNVIQGRWEEAELAILQDSYNALCYTRDIIKARWKELEATITTDEFYTYIYARDVLKWGLWNNKDFYISVIPILWGQFPQHIKNDPDIMTVYFKEAILQ